MAWSTSAITYCKNEHYKQFVKCLTKIKGLILLHIVYLAENNI